MALGDNFYNQGVASVNDPKFQNYYSNLYNGPGTNIPWYVVLGNHDYYGANQTNWNMVNKMNTGTTANLKGAMAQLQYGAQNMDPTGRWTMPCTSLPCQYSRTWTIPGSTKTMQIVFVDTPYLAPEAKCGASFNHIGWACPKNQLNATLAGKAATSVKLVDGTMYNQAGVTDDGPMATKGATASIGAKAIWQPALQWVQNTLAASTADYLFVAGHYHIFTNTVGDTATPEAMILQSRLLPLLKKYNVTAYFHGHEHNVEHFVVNGMHHIANGHGGTKNDGLDPQMGAASSHPEVKMGYLKYNVTNVAAVTVMDVYATGR